VPKHLTLTLAALAALALVVAGCGSNDESASTTTATTQAGVTGELTVSAAASLTEAFTTIQADFAQDNPDAEVTFNFGSSGSLSTQVQEGAPADVVAFADTTPMSALADADLLLGEARIFARNQLVIVTKPGNPTGISSLADLADAGIVSLCVDTAPCGRFADQVLADAGVTIPVTRINRGSDVKSTLTAVTEGDAVAGIVYVTDATAAGDRVDTVEIPEARNVIADYPIAVVASSGSTALAEAFVAHVLSEEGRAVLADAGFLAP
jgi:molybdate transport system substrate-binding protein